MGIDEVSERLGSLGSEVGSLGSQVENLTDTWQRQDQQATEGRRILHSKFDALQADVAAKLQDVALKLNAVLIRMDVIERDLSKLSPKIEISHDDRQQMIGSKKALALVWALLVGVVTALTTGAVELIHWWMSLPPSHPPH